MEQPTTSPPGRRARALGPGLTAFVVVDALLVLAVLVALVAHLSGGPSADAPGAGTSVPGPGASAPVEATPGGTAAAEGTQPDAFALPSGNIACRITDTAATCTIAETTAEPVPLDDCAGAAGQVLTVTADGVGTPCVQGALPGPAAPGTPVLEYGRSTTVGEFTCDSATTGVTCRHDPTGAGFTLARAGHEILEPAG